MFTGHFEEGNHVGVYSKNTVVKNINYFKMDLHIGYIKDCHILTHRHQWYFYFRLIEMLNRCLGSATINTSHDKNLIWQNVAFLEKIKIK